jgi:hypothetical protein
MQVTHDTRHTGEDVYRLFVENTNYRKASYKHKQRDNEESSAAASARATTGAPCTSVFIEPMVWMLELGIDELKKSDGCFYCPKCRTRIGSWSWQGTHRRLVGTHHH